jgi:putative N6-adenine-specific DNA methylase
MDWVGFDPGAWAQVVAEARAAERPTAAAPIVASDRDAGAIEAARGNAERAGVAADIDFRRQPLSAVEPPGAEGWLATNPPYGVRVGDRRSLRDLYAQLGNVARSRWSGWTLSLISADRTLERQLRLPLRELARTTNGGIPVRLLAAGVP